MNPKLQFTSGLLVSLFFGALSFGGGSASARDLWSTGYHPGWTQGQMPASAIDYSALSHVIHFAVIPRVDGTLDTETLSLTPSHIADSVSRGHAAGVKVLVCVGGAGTSAGFRGATQPAKLAGFINRLVTFVTSKGYDGLDVDWEPLDESDTPAYQNLVRGLRSTLNQRKPGSLLTAAAAEQPALFSSVQGEFDQINVMTYDMAGPWPGWVTWFNAALFDGGFRFPSTGGLITSADGLINRFISAGVQPAKLGLGIPFYGIVWKGGTGLPAGGATLPRQEWTSAPEVTALAFREIMANHYTAERYRWDPNAYAPYLTVNNPGSSEDLFVAFDDERSCRAKVSYARNRGLGGVMIWELSQDYQASSPLAQRHPLLAAMKESLEAPRFSSIEQVGQSVRLSFQTMPLARYAVQWSTGTLGGSWSNLVVRIGDGEPMIVNDSLAGKGPARYYRIKTPP